MIDNNPSSNNTNKTDVNTGRPTIPKNSLKGKIFESVLLREDVQAPRVYIQVTSRPSSSSDYFYDLYTKGLESPEEKEGWININD